MLSNDRVAFRLGVSIRRGLVDRVNPIWLFRVAQRDSHRGGACAVREKCPLEWCGADGACCGTAATPSFPQAPSQESRGGPTFSACPIDTTSWRASVRARKVVL